MFYLTQNILTLPPESSFFVMIVQSHLRFSQQKNQSQKEKAFDGIQYHQMPLLRRIPSALLFFLNFSIIYDHKIIPVLYALKSIYRTNDKINFPGMIEIQHSQKQNGINPRKNWNTPFSVGHYMN